jgi:uncharacterized protein (TIGR00255 family)
VYRSRGTVGSNPTLSADNEPGCRSQPGFSCTRLYRDMLTSMTGFGRGTASDAGVEAIVEIRSVNSRFAEVSIRGPRSVNALEQEIQTKAKQKLERGRINIQIDVTESVEDELDMDLNPGAVSAYVNLLGRLRDQAGIKEDLRLEHILRFDDVFTSKGLDEAFEKRRGETVMRALDAALDALVDMRRREGEALSRELEHRVQLIEEALAKVEERSPRRIDEARTRLRDRVAEILGDERIDPERIEVEIVMLADRLDVTEETVRLRSHIELFREAIADDDSAGRKLNFISQEMNREVNTIGSKANDPELARYVVSMKEELEKIREQIQNVE